MSIACRMQMFHFIQRQNMSELMKLFLGRIQKQMLFTVALKLKHFGYAFKQLCLHYDRQGM